MGLAVVDTPARGVHHRHGEATLSQELHTARLPWPHVLVGYWWQHTRLCLGYLQHNSYSCDFVSQPSQKPACGFPAQASSTSSSPNGVHRDQRTRTWEWIARGIAPEAVPREAAPLATMIEPFEQEFVDRPFKAVQSTAV